MQILLHNTVSVVEFVRNLHSIGYEICFYFVKYEHFVHHCVFLVADQSSMSPINGCFANQFHPRGFISASRFFPFAHN